MANFKTLTLSAAAVVAAALVMLGSVAPSALAAQATAAATQPPISAQSQGTPIPGAGIVTAGLSGEATALTGAGATFPQPLYTQWFAIYAKLTGVQINYQGVGSGAGVKAVTDGTVDLGASDKFMTDAELKAASDAGHEVVNIPMTSGAVAMSYNIPDLKDTLKLTSDDIAGIFAGTIANWNDPALVKDNPGLANVNQPIITAHRSDSSGTTNMFTTYLSTVNSNWAAAIGAGTAVNWPGGLGGKGTAGVAGLIKQNAYAIGYIELTYALQNKLPAALVENKAGKWVAPSLDGVTAAAAAFQAQTPADLRFMIVNADGDASYPISGYTWMLFYKSYKGADAAKAQAVTRFAWWALHDGQSYAKSLYYAPLAYPIVQKAEALLFQINIDGKQALPTSVATPSATAAS